MSSESALSAEMLKELKNFLKKNKRTDLLSVYLRYVEELYNIRPVIFPGSKTIFRSVKSAIDLLQKEGKVWRETEATVSYERGAVNEQTKKIYICPYSGKVFGDNTHRNPQDAIYNWVATCPANTERAGGLRAKRFLVSEDPEVIRNYIKPARKTILKKVFSCPCNNKLYHSREVLLEEFTKSYLKPVSLFEVQNQTRFTIQEELMALLHAYIKEELVSDFVEEISKDPTMKKFALLWIEEDQEAKE